MSIRRTARAVTFTLVLALGTLLATPLRAQFPRADIGLDFITPATAETGSSFTVRFAVDNQGPQPAPDVRLDVYGTGVVLLPTTDTASEWRCTYFLDVSRTAAGAASHVQCLLSELGVGRRDVVLSAQTLNAPGTARVEAVVNSDVEDADVSDRHLVRNVGIPAVTATADLAITLRDTAALDPSEGLFHAEVVVTNQGPAAIPEVTIYNTHSGTDGATMRNFSGASCLASSSPSRVDCTMNWLLSGETRVLRYTLRTTTTPRIIRHSALARGAGFTDTNPSNNANMSSTRLGSAALYSRVLVPIAIPETPGNFGSLWRSELTVFADVDKDVTFFPVSYNCPFLCPPHGEVTAPRKRSWSVPLAVGPQQPNPGYLLYFPREFEKQVYFGLHVRDVSRALTDLGTEIPVVSDRDLHEGRLQIVNVASGGNYRSLLRIYNPEAIGGPVTVRLFARSGDQEVMVSEQTVSLIVPPDNEVAGVLQLPMRPSYGEARLTDPRALPVASVYRVEVESPDPGFRMWAFVSSTNNDTQFVTISTPRKAVSNP